MRGSECKEAAAKLTFKAKGRPALLQRLVVDGFFDAPVSSEQIVKKIGERFGKRWKTKWVQLYLRKFMDGDIIHAVKLAGQKANYYVLASVTRDDAVRQIGKSSGVKDIEGELFSSALSVALKKDFEHELAELHDNFGRNGN